MWYNKIKIMKLFELQYDFLNHSSGCYGSLGPFLTKISRTFDHYLSDLKNWPLSIGPWPKSLGPSKLTNISRTFDHYLSDLSNWPKSLGPMAKISRSFLAIISRTIYKKVSRTSFDIFCILWLRWIFVMDDQFSFFH